MRYTRALGSREDDWFVRRRPMQRSVPPDWTRLLLGNGSGEIISPRVSLSLCLYLSLSVCVYLSSATSLIYLLHSLVLFQVYHTTNPSPFTSPLASSPSPTPSLSPSSSSPIYLSPSLPSLSPSLPSHSHSVSLSLWLYLYISQPFPLPLHPLLTRHLPLPHLVPYIRHIARYIILYNIMLKWNLF